MLQLGWVHVRVLSTREGQWGLFGGLWVCIIVNHPLTEPPVPTNNFQDTITTAKNKYGVLCAPRHDAAIGPGGAEFVW